MFPHTIDSSPKAKENRVRGMLWQARQRRKSQSSLLEGVYSASTLSPSPRAPTHVVSLVQGIDGRHAKRKCPEGDNSSIFEVDDRAARLFKVCQSKN